MTELEASLRLRLVDEVSQQTRSIEQGLRRVSGAADFSRASRSSLQFGRQLNAVKGSARGLATVANEASHVATEMTQAAAAADGLADATGRASAATGPARRGFFRVTDASRRQGRAMAENLNLVSELALGFGGLNPSLQQASIAFAGAGNNAFALAGALGPIGVIGGTLVALLPSLISGFTGTSDAVDSSAESARRAIPTFEDLRDRIREVREEQEAYRRLLAGEENVEETRDALEAQRQLLADRRQRRDTLRGSIAGRFRTNASRRAVEEALGEGVTDPAELRARIVEAVREANPRASEAAFRAAVAPLAQVQSELGQFRTTQTSIAKQEEELPRLEVAVRRAEERAAAEQAEEEARRVADQRREDESALRRTLEARIAQVGSRRLRQRLRTGLREGSLAPDSGLLRRAFGQGEERDEVSGYLEGLRRLQAVEAASAEETARAAVERAADRSPEGGQATPRGQLQVNVEVSDERVRATVEARDDELGVVVGEGAELGGAG